MEPATVIAAGRAAGMALSPVSSAIGSIWVASSNLGRNADALKRALLSAEGILEITRSKEIHQGALAEQLQKLQDLAYDARDMLDELEYFRIQDKVEGTYETADRGCFRNLIRDTRHTTRAVMSKLTSCCASKEDPGDDEIKQDAAPRRRHQDIPSLPDQDNSEVDGKGCIHKLGCGSGACKSLWKKKQPVKTTKLELNRVALSERMKDILDELLQVCANVATTLNLQLDSIPNVRTTADRHKAGPITEEPHLFGREDQMKLIMDGINHKFCEEKELTIIPIVGHGGIGKTTFAQNVYKNAKSLFQATAWVCVSSSYNVNNLIQEIKGKIPMVEGENTNTTDEELIQQRLKSRRFLIVFDDIWKCHEDDWKKLLAPLREGGAKGNMVLITTRFSNLPKELGIAEHLIELKGLAKEPIEDYFKVCIFGQRQPNNEELSLFNDIGRKIVEKLKGSPLAAKTVGRLIRGEEQEHWRKVLESKEWEQLKDDNNIMPILKLSYDYLPFHLQQCFACCALFPEDYRFRKEELIHLWTGLEISEANAHSMTEHILIGYLKELVMHGFFDPVQEYDEDYYVIHDLLHDLALRIPSNECLSICYPVVRSEEIHPSVRHLSIIIKEYEKDNMIIEKFITELKTVKEKLKVKNLRTVMIFDDHGLLEQSFGDLFKELNSLRVFLVYSSTTDSVTHMLEKNLSKFIHLRYLKLGLGRVDMPAEAQLPSTVSRFYHLRTLDLQEWYKGLFNFPSDMSNLVNLHFFVKGGDDHDSEISRVGKLKFLRELKRFSVRRREEGFDLKELGPLMEINRLGIYNLENVSMEEAGDAKFEHKTNLLELTLQWGSQGTSAGPAVETYVLESLRPHSSLKKLSIIGHSGSTCPTWLDRDMSVTGLQTLNLDGVGWKDLRSLEQLNLRSLKVNDSENLLLPPIPWTHTLCNVDITEAGSIFHLSYKKDELFLIGSEFDERVLAFHNLTGIETLIIRNCPPLAEQHIQKLTSLKYLKLIDMDGFLQPSSNGGSDVKCQLPVQSLELIRCSVGGEDLTRLLYCFPALSDLQIDKCKIITRTDVMVAGQEEATTTTTKPSASATRLEDARLQQNQLQETNQEDEEIIVAQQEEGLLVLPPNICSSLESLLIKHCSDLILVPQGGGLQVLSSLAKLEILGCPKIFARWATSWEQNENICSCKLEYIKTDDSAGLFTTSVCSLLSSSLTELTLNSKVITFTEGQENALQLLTSLKKLQFSFCFRLEVLPQCLDKLSKLEELRILHCYCLRWSENQSLPSSLQVLDVRCCNRKLEEECRKLKGTVPQVISEEWW